MLAMLLRLKKIRQDGKWFMKFRYECIVLFVVQPTKSKILQIYRTIYMRLYMFRCEKLRYSSKWLKKYKKDTDKI